MEKEGSRPSSQTVLGKKRNKASSHVPSGGFILTEKANGCTGWLVCLLYLWKRKKACVDRFSFPCKLTLLGLGLTLFTCFFVSSFLPDPFCSQTVSSVLPVTPLAMSSGPLTAQCKPSDTPNTHSRSLLYNENFFISFVIFPSQILSAGRAPFPLFLSSFDQGISCKHG